MYLAGVATFFFLAINVHHLAVMPITITIQGDAFADDATQKSSNFISIAYDVSTMAPPLNTKIPEPQDRPWYMQEGELLPEQQLPGERAVQVYPEEKPNYDRIPEQLMFYPESVPENSENSETPLKKILLWNGASSWGGIRPGRGVFLKEKCPVNSCVIASNKQEVQSANLVVFKDHFTMPGFDRPSDQLWMMYMLECPLHTQLFKHREVFNWTSTYRSDSTIVAPYERWQYYNDNVQTVKNGRNFAANKTKKVAWFVSNCGAKNGRLDYARKLGEHIGVDIYGACGPKRCPQNSNRCFEMLNADYKFYLAFENSNCKDYITEKFYVNGLGHDVLPIVMGARPQDYEIRAPYKSYIHVDDFSGPEALAEYLHKIDNDDELYNEYFQWKGTGEFVNTKFFCRLCTMLHDDKVREEEKSYYKDINEWWRGDGTCIKGSWRAFDRAMEKRKEQNKTITNDTKKQDDS